MSHPKAEEGNIYPFEDVVKDDDVQKSQENPIPSQEGNESIFPSSSEEEITKKKYGGLLRKKHPLISMGHEHAFFDSADWELRKQGGQKSKGLLEKLRPKLEPTPHHHLSSRRLAYDPPDNDGDTIYVHEEHKRSVDTNNANDDDYREQDQQNGQDCKISRMVIANGQENNR